MPKWGGTRLRKNNQYIHNDQIDWSVRMSGGCISMKENGAGGETRTPNRPITNRVLYQLSHTSTERWYNQKPLCASSDK